MVEADIDIPKVRPGRLWSAVSLTTSLLVPLITFFVEREDTPHAPPPPDPERHWSANSLQCMEPLLQKKLVLISG